MAFLLTNFGTGTGNSCSVDDKLFNNFSYVPGAGGTVAALVTSTLLFNSIAMTYGWEFSVAGGAFVGGFTLGYTVAIDETKCPVPGGCTDVNSEEQIFPGTVPPGTQAASVALTSNGSPSSTVISLDNMMLGNTIGDAFFTGSTSITKLATVTGISPSQPLLSFQSRVTEAVTVVPEPLTFSLMGIGLLSLGTMIRRCTRKVN
jgi:hypothetical protein